MSLRVPAAALLKCCQYIPEVSSLRRELALYTIKRELRMTWQLLCLCQSAAHLADPVVKAENFSLCSWSSYHCCLHSSSRMCSLLQGQAERSTMGPPHACCRRRRHHLLHCDTQVHTSPSGDTGHICCTCSAQCVSREAKLCNPNLEYALFLCIPSKRRAVGERLQHSVCPAYLQNSLEAV